MFYIFGLGNPGHSYENSRHSVGRSFVFSFQEKNNFSPWKENKKKGFEIAEGLYEKEKVTLIVSNEFMNKSGNTAKKIIKNMSSAKNLIVIHDEIDLPFGTVKIVYNRGSGGHKGIQSVNRALRTEEFFRIRVGISPATPKGKIRKPTDKEKMVDFVIGNFTPKEKEYLKKEIFNRIQEGVERIIKGTISPEKKGMSLAYTIRR